jgi:hypothetical protein
MMGQDLEFKLLIEEIQVIFVQEFIYVTTGNLSLKKIILQPWIL